MWQPSSAVWSRIPAITHLAIVHHETTTGRLNDIAAVGKLCKTRGVTLLLDAVSSFGAEQIDAMGWNLGALAATANKCLHGAPGLSFVLARNELWAGPAQQAGSVYLDLRAYHAAQHRDGYSPFTLPVQLAFALHEALLEHAEQGGAEAAPPALSNPCAAYPCHAVAQWREHAAASGRILQRVVVLRSCRQIGAMPNCMMR